MSKIYKVNGIYHPEHNPDGHINREEGAKESIHNYIGELAALKKEMTKIKTKQTKLENKLAKNNS